MERKPQPIQPLIKDDLGTTRFQKNAIVAFLLDHGGHDMNDLAMREFPQEDREQFAQLIGYSLSGFAELSYVRNDTYATAARMAVGETEEQAKIAALESQLKTVRSLVRRMATKLFQIHPDDLRD